MGYVMTQHNKLLTVLIPTLSNRENRTIDLTMSILGNYCEFIIDDTYNISIGRKRDRLMHKVNTKYFVFIDDDDIISDDYTEVIDHLHKDVDIVTFNQKVIEDGIEKPIVKLGKDFPINHLCIYRTEFRDELTFGDYGTNEDLCFVDSIGHAKFEISKIAHIDKVLYIYERNTKIKKEYHRHKMFRNSKSMNFSELMRHEDRIFPHNENSWRL
jgi:hypothetical protein